MVCNTDSAPHRHRIREGGKYAYHCTYDPDMHGTSVVCG